MKPEQLALYGAVFTELQRVTNKVTPLQSGSGEFYEQDPPPPPLGGEVYGRRSVAPGRKQGTREETVAIEIKAPFAEGLKLVATRTDPGNQITDVRAEYEQPLGSKMITGASAFKEIEHVLTSLRGMRTVS